MGILLGAPSSSPPPLAMGGSKKKVDPKEAKAAAKAKAEKRQAAAADKTFGLKNKNKSDVRAGGAEEGGADFSQYGKASSDVEDSDDEDVAAGLTAEDEVALAALGDEDLAALEDVDAL